MALRFHTQFLVVLLLVPTMMGCGAGNKNPVNESPRLRLSSAARVRQTLPTLNEKSTIRVRIKVYSGETSYHVWQFSELVTWPPRFDRILGCDDDNTPSHHCRLTAGTTDEPAA